MFTCSDRERRFLNIAGRLALRGHGHVEPNPMVGCVIVDQRGSIVGAGHHRRLGGAHAEIEALAAAGDAATGGTMYVTLEPCRHSGRTGPCTDAILRAGLDRVVIAQRDPHPEHGGGIDILKSAGITVEVNEGSVLANDVSAPFRRRVATGRPWIVAKWAQTMDGRIETVHTPGRPPWISNETSRRLVHRERGRVDAILTGLGTVLADDPMLTVRGVHARRQPLRVVLDTNLRVPLDSRLLATIGEAPLLVVTANEDARCKVAITCRGGLVETVARNGQMLDLREVLRLLAARNLATVLVEAGPRLLSSFFGEQLVDQAWVFIGGGAVDPQRACASAEIVMLNRLGAGSPLSRRSMRRRGDDLVLLYQAD